MLLNEATVVGLSICLTLCGSVAAIAPSGTQSRTSAAAQFFAEKSGKHFPKIPPVASGLRSLSVDDRDEPDHAPLPFVLRYS